MPLFVDHAGMNTLVSQELDTEANLMSLKQRDGLPSRSFRSSGTEASYSLFMYQQNSPTTGGISFSFWVNLDDIPSNTNTRYVYDAPNSGQTVRESIYFAANRIYVQFYDINYDYKYWAFTLPVADLIDVWSHIWIGWDMNWGNDPVCYINGQELSLVSSSGLATDDLAISGFSSIGQRHMNISPNYRLEGRIQSFGIWNSFDESDVPLLYNNGLVNNVDLPNTSSILDFWLLGDEEVFDYQNLGDVPSRTFRSISGRKTPVRTNPQRESLTIANGAPLSSKSSGFISNISEGKTLVALSTHRNGPYGFSTWKQLRLSENPLTRYHIKNSELSFVTTPGRLRNVGDGEDLYVRDRHSIIYNYDEPCVTERHYPVVWNVGRHIRNRDGSISNIPQKFSIMSSFGNELVSFSNESVDKLLKYDPKEEDTDYAEIIKLYLDGGMNSQESPLTYWEFMQYRETVFPKQVNQFRLDTRDRPSFESFYNKTRSERNGFYFTSSVGFTPAVKDGEFYVPLVQSKWDMDEDEYFLTRDYNNEYSAVDWRGDSLIDHNYPNSRGNGSYAGRFGEGSLISTTNQFSMYHYNYRGFISSNYSGMTDQEIEEAVRHANNTMHPGPLYMRRISLHSTQSLSSPSGMLIPETGSMANSDVIKYQGGALWEVGATREVKTRVGTYISAPKEPSYDTYSDFALEIQKKGKNYAVVPEFRMSEQFEDIYKSKDFLELDLFEVTGGIDGKADSSKAGFYNIYSNTEFMKNFEVIQEDHKDFTNASILSLRCKAIKKFLPYKGFYPAQRTAQLAEKFYNDIKDNISVLNYTGVEFSEIEIGKQPTMTPLFAPGILFNTIKSGIAVDFPVKTKNVDTSADASQGVSNNYIKNDYFDLRIPFEGIITPQDYIKNENIYGMEPDTYGFLSASSTWNGDGADVYTFMANNFMAEVPSFFLEGGNMSAIVSKKQSDIGVLKKDVVYGMRIKMRRSMGKWRKTVSGSVGYYYPPQDIILTGSKACRETFTMYSRPSAFGPPTFGKTRFSNAAVQDLLAHQDRFTWDTDTLYQDSHNGFNYPFTPPYYHGEAWCDIVITGSGDKLTLATLQQSASYTYTRYDGSYLLPTPLTIHSSEGPQAVDKINDNAMQLSASVIVDGLGRAALRGKKGGTVTSQIIVDSGVNEDSRWIIQPKLETPMLNFNHISEANGNLTLPVYGSESVPRGMWHQYGRIPDTKEGVYLEVARIPANWQTNVMGRTTQMKNLAEFLGFNNSSTKLGKIAKKKTVYEAVVAVPFIKEDGRRKFFRIDKLKVDMFKEGKLQEITTGPASGQIGRSVLDQLEKMRKYVFPPSMDFLNYDEVKPFAMYIFEFEHTFNQQDLADIWQNLPPDLAETMETSEVAITHPLLQKELLGKGGNNGNATLDLPERLQWMVFKVKQRAASNYFKKVVKSNAALNTDPDSSNSSTDEYGSSTPLQFNWPYDYFSMIEMVKIDAEVEIGNADLSNYTDNLPRWNAVVATPTAVSDMLAPLPQAVPEPQVIIIREEPAFVQEAQDKQQTAETETFTSATTNENETALPNEIPVVETQTEPEPVSQTSMEEWQAEMDKMQAAMDEVAASIDAKMGNTSSVGAGGPTNPGSGKAPSAGVGGFSAQMGELDEATAGAGGITGALGGVLDQIDEGDGNDSAQSSLNGNNGLGSNGGAGSGGIV